MRCVCDALYAGCEHPGRCRDLVTDARWGPWCNPCNVRRFAHLDAQFAEIGAQFEQKGG